MKPFLFSVPYLAAAVVISLIVALIYVTVQQNYRSSANDPQIQFARDIYSRLQTGRSIQNYLSDTINLENSLEVFATVFDERGNASASSGYLDGRFPQLPSGVFDFTKTHGQDIITWQPNPAVRVATVVLYTNAPAKGYIAVGRSLKETEIREHNLRMTVFIAWLTSIAVIATAGLIQFIGLNKYKFS